MFDLGMQELIVIFIVALLVFGPKRLPELGKNLGKGLAELKKAMHGVKEQMDAEMREINKPIEEIKKPLSFDAELYKKAAELAKKDAEKIAAEEQAPAELPRTEETITGKSKKPVVVETVAAEKEEDSPKDPA
jgi:sec-independent protein translocase protein TatB